MKLALVGINPLHALGMRSLIESIDDRVEVAIATEDDNAWQQSDRYIVSASAIACYPRIFMPRLSQVLLLSSSPVLKKEGGLPVISPLSSLQELRAAVGKLLASTPAHTHSFAGQMPAAPNPQLLTDRELDVMRLLARGASGKEIAEKLGISINTVLTHRKKISDKLNIHSAPALVYYALTHNIF